MRFRSIVPAGTVVQVCRPVHDRERVLRPALVAVARAARSQRFRAELNLDVADWMRLTRLRHVCQLWRAALGVDSAAGVFTT